MKTELITHSEFHKLNYLIEPYRQNHEKISAPFVGSSGRTFLTAPQSILFVGIAPGNNEDESEDKPDASFEIVAAKLEKIRSVKLKFGGGVFWNWITNVRQAVRERGGYASIAAFDNGMAWDNLLRFNIYKAAPAPSRRLADVQLKYCRELFKQVVRRTSPRIVVVMGGQNYFGLWNERDFKDRMSERKFPGDTLVSGSLYNSQVIWISHPRYRRKTLKAEAEYIAQKFVTLR
jgi:uracil-DNA glycosylase